MPILDRFFKEKIDKEVAIEVAAKEALIKAEMDRKVLEIEERMVEVSERKVAEKTREFQEMVNDQLEKARKNAEDAEAKSLLHDPFQLLESLRYKERPMMLTYEVLRAMAERNPIIAAIIQTRANQVASFSTPPKTDYDIGYRISLRDDEAKPSKADEKRVKEIETMIENTGLEDMFMAEERDNFDSYLRKITRDTLTYDQMAFEVINGRAKNPIGFLAIDAATIRLASTAKYFKDIKQMKGFQPPALMQPPPLTLEMGSKQKEEVKPEDIRYVQILDGKVVTTYTEQELGFGIRNARTNIKQNGYGVSELEILVNTVTAHLWAEEYNRRFFCVSLINSSIYTNNGIFYLKDLIGKNFKIWNGNEYVRARAFETGVRPLVRTKLWNGIELRTSPEHRFLAIPKDTQSGEPEWKEQKNLQLDDFVLVDHRNHDFSMNYYLLKTDEHYLNRKKEKTYKTYTVRKSWKDNPNTDQWSPSKEMIDDPEFWEMIGFALGDGYWGETWMGIYPNPTREKDILEKFKKVCERYSDVEGRVVLNNPASVRKSDGEKGYPALQITNEGFMCWLYDIGFQLSTNRKKNRRIPSIFFQLPSWIRCALLRGLFSADGTNQGYKQAGTPAFGSSDPGFRQDALKCLWSVGVASNEQGKGWREGSGAILVQDIEAFATRIGFLQTQENSIKSKSNLVRSHSKNRWDQLHPVLSKVLAQKIKEKSRYSGEPKINQYGSKVDINLTKRDRWMLTSAVVGNTKFSRPRAIELMDKLGIDVPDWLRNFVQVPIDVLDKEPIAYEPMGDVEVFDDKHIFLCNGVAVHNSQGSAPKGIISFEGNVPAEQLNAFRRQWHAQVMGVFNSWKTPVVSAPAKLQYTNLQMSNRQMEFSNWIDYLIKIACAVYLIDPAEIGFDMRGGAQTSQPPVFESHQDARLKMSKDRGLRPLLKFLQSQMNKNVVFRLDNSRFEFEFVGLDTKTEEQLQEMHLKEVQNFKTIDEVRVEYDLKPLGKDRAGDVIMNPAYLSYLQQLSMAKMQQEQMGGGGGPGEEEPGEGADFGEESGPDFGEEEEPLEND